MTNVRSPIAFLPIITKARELDARVLLASYLLREGYRVVIGRSGEVNGLCRRARNGLYFSPLLVRAASGRLKNLKKRGHIIIGWDEEGLVYPDPDWYFSNRVSAESAQYADALIGWGETPSRDLAATLPKDIGPIFPFGNARIDLLRPPFRSIYETEAARLRQKFGPFVIVNTNFDMVNHVDGPGGLERRMRASGRIRGEKDERKFAEWAVFRRAAFEAFQEGLPLIHDGCPEVNIVLRPHPSESLDIWEDLVKNYPRLFLQPPSGPVYPWLLAAEAVVHNSCTTAVEAFMFGIPVVAFHPEVSAGSMDSPLPNQLSRPAHTWAEVVELIKLERSSESGGQWATDKEVAVADAFIGSRTGSYSSEKIVELIGRLGALSLDTQFDLPLPLIKTIRAVKRRVSTDVFGRRRPPDDRARFAGLTREELSELFEKFTDISKDVKIERLGEDLFICNQNE